MPRTATTAVGKIISFSPNYSLLHEPFNIDSGINSIKHRFIVPGKTISIEEFNLLIENIKKLRLNLKKGIFDDDYAFKKLVKFFIGGRTYHSYLKSKIQKTETIIVKDPFLCFSISQLSKDYKVIITERPLKNIAASYKRMGWSYMSLDSNRLARELNYNIKEIQAIIKKSKNISKEVEAAILIFSLMEYYKRKIDLNPNLYFLNQDELSTKPISSASRLFNFLELPFDNNIIEKINVLNNSKSTKNIPSLKKAHDKNYNKKFANKYFSKILNKDEIKLIEAIHFE